MSAMMLPKKQAVIKSQAHKKGNDFVRKGNNAADEAACVAPKCQKAVLVPVVTVEPITT